MTDHRFHFVYKTTNLVNGKIYIGKHSTNSIDDGYLGSGTVLRRAIQKYRSENFSREILEFFNTSEEAEIAESKIVTVDFLQREDVYNKAPGGYGGNISLFPENPDYEKICSRISKSHLLRSKEISLAASEGHRSNPNYAMNGKTQSSHQKNAVSIRLKGSIIITNGVSNRRIKPGQTEIPEGWKRGITKKTKPLSGSNNPMFGKKHSAESKRKMSEKKQLRDAQNLS